MYRIILCVICLSLVSCISKKKFAAVENEQAQLKKENNILFTEIQEATSKIDKQRQTIEDQRDQMIKQNVLNNQLITEKIDLQKRVSELDRRINLVTDEARSAQQTLNDELQNEIRELQERITILDNLEKEYFIIKQKMDDLITRLGPLTQKFGSAVEIVQHNDRVICIASSDMIFGSNYFVITNQGKQLFDDYAGIAADYPEFFIEIQGHYDNSVLSETRYYRDVIDYTSRRAAAIVRYLNKEEGINGNQLGAKGMGGYFPRVSNATPAGQKYNRRIELHISPSVQLFWELMEE